MSVLYGAPSHLCCRLAGRGVFSMEHQVIGCWVISVGVWPRRMLGFVFSMGNQVIGCWGHLCCRLAARDAPVGLSVLWAPSHLVSRPPSIGGRVTGPALTSSWSYATYILITTLPLFTCSRLIWLCLLLFIIIIATLVFHHLTGLVGLQASFCSGEELKRRWARMELCPVETLAG
jgi:hypothetical protein